MGMLRKKSPRWDGASIYKSEGEILGEIRVFGMIRDDVKHARRHPRMPGIVDIYMYGGLGDLRNREGCSGSGNYAKDLREDLFTRPSATCLRDRGRGSQCRRKRRWTAGCSLA